jgi:hypothetical protein
MLASAIIYVDPSSHPELDVSVGAANIIALLAVAATIGTLINSNWQDRELAKRQFADQIRNSAALLTVKLERWRDLADSFFDEIQPDITDADMSLVKGRNVPETRDLFWKALGIVWLSISKRISDEEIELSYVNLYGYDPNVRELFLTAISRLRALRSSVQDETLMRTQEEIRSMDVGKAKSSDLGNKLRTVAGLIEGKFYERASLIIKPFEKEMIRLIEASDREIASKTVQLSSAEQIFPQQQDTLRG